MDRYCLGCMEPIENGIDVCPRCGYAQSTPPGEVYHLEPGTILKNRYLVGRVLGFGGFGVTYIGRDLVLENVVAIKEYLPSEFATRVQGQQTLSVYTGEAASQFDAGLKSFSDEAKRLAKFKDVPGVVEIADTFSENKTAYIVMEYLEGETVKQLLEREGKLPYDTVEEIMTSVLATLSAVHPSGIIHRDVSPANIFLTTDGKIKLLDFGAARYASAYHTKSLSVILKPGYAPEEQYRSHGNQGPWTDVYSAAATMYKMLTGKTPQESIERMAHDELKEPSKLGIAIDKNKENALMNALNVDIPMRTQSASQFLEELTGKADVDRVRVRKNKVDEGRWPWWMKAGAAVVPLLLAGVIVLLSLNKGEVMHNDDFTTVPNLLTMDEVTARKTLEDSELYMRVDGTIAVDFGDSGVVQKLDPAGGAYIKKYETVGVELSVNDTVFMPYVQYRGIDDATALMEQAGLNVKIEYVDTADYAEDTVIWQEYPEGTSLTKNSLVALKVAIGSPTEDTGETAEVPDVSGMTVEDALKTLRESGLYGVVTAEENGEAEFGTVLASGLTGETVNKNSVIELTVSLGHEYVRMPSLGLKSKSEAQAILEGLGLTVKFEYRQTNDYAEDLVLEQSVAVGTKLSEGDVVTLTLSRPEYGTVPEVVGLNESDAVARIEQAGFTARVSTETVYSDTVAKGLVVNQSAVGQLAKGRVVTIAISAGVSTKTAPVPSVAGLSAGDAEYRIVTAGFGYAYGGEEYSETVPKGAVISCSPTGSQTLGTTVTVIVSKGPSPKPVPGVIGQSQSAAQSALSSMGLTVSVSSEHSETVPYGAVISQSPAAGTLVEQGSAISIVVSCGTAGKYVSPAEIGNYPASQYTQSPVQEYQYTVTTRETTTQTVHSLTAPEMPGWTVYGDSVQVVGEWSPWTKGTAPAVDPNLTNVKTEQKEEQYLESYWMLTYCYMRDADREYSMVQLSRDELEQNGYSTGYGNGGFFKYTISGLSPDVLAKAMKVAPNDYWYPNDKSVSSNGGGTWKGDRYSGLNIYSQTAYAIDGRLYFIGGTNYGTRYIDGYRTQNIDYTYTYERYVTSAPSGWIQDPNQIPSNTENTTVSTESRVGSYYVTGIPF